MQREYFGSWGRIIIGPFGPFWNLIHLSFGRSSFHLFASSSQWRRTHVKCSQLLGILHHYLSSSLWQSCSSFSLCQHHPLARLIRSRAGRAERMGRDFARTFRGEINLDANFQFTSSHNLFRSLSLSFQEEDKKNQISIRHVIKPLSVFSCPSLCLRASPAGIFTNILLTRSPLSSRVPSRGEGERTMFHIIPTMMMGDL